MTDVDIDAIDLKYRRIIRVWSVVVVSWLFTLALIQAVDNLTLREVQEQAQRFLQIKGDMLTEIELLKRQIEMYKTDSYIARINPDLQYTKRARIVKAAYECSDRVGIDPLFTLAVMEQESRFRPKAMSDKDAHGLMQLIPSTAAGLGIQKKDIYNIEQNICGGAAYLAQHIKTYNGQLKQVLRRYYGGGTEQEYPIPVLNRYTKIQQQIRM